MNAQQLAERYSLKTVQIKDENIIWAFEAGYDACQQAEVNKLVEALREVIKVAENQYEENKASADWFNNNMPGVGINLQYQSTVPLPKWVEKAKEVLKPYIPSPEK